MLKAAVIKAEITPAFHPPGGLYESQIHRQAQFTCVNINNKIKSVIILIR